MHDAPLSMQSRALSDVLILTVAALCTESSVHLTRESEVYKACQKEVDSRETSVFVVD